MTSSLFIKNQQRTHPLKIRHLRWMTRELLHDHLFIEDFDLGIYIVRSDKMAKLNRIYLQHHGSTDVITFDYQDDAIKNPESEIKLHGEIFICIDKAIAHARQFRTTWQSEMVRYVIHGILHLLGYDDLKPATRRIMKREENRLLKRLKDTYPLAKLAG